VEAGAVDQRLLDPTVGEEHGRGERDDAGTGEAGQGGGQLGPGPAALGRPVEDRDHLGRRHAGGPEVGEHARQGVRALEAGQPHGEDDVGAQHGGAAHDVALLHVERAALVLALDVGVGVADHDPVRGAQRLEGGAERPRPERRPEPGPAQAEQEVVAALVHVEGEGADLLGREAAAAVLLHQLLDAGHHVARVMEHRLVGVQRQVGEEDGVTQAGVVGQALGEGDGHRRRAGPARPAHRCHGPPPRRHRLGHGVARDGVAAADRPGMGGQRVEEGLGVEEVGEHGRHPDRRPVARPAAVVHGDGGAPGVAGGVHQVAVEGGQGAVHHQRRERPSRRQAGPYLLAGDALHELGGDGARVGPLGDGPEPARASPGEPEDDETLGHPQPPRGTVGRAARGAE